MGALDKRIFSGVAIVSALLFVVAAVMLLANGGEVVDDANDIALYIVTVAGIMAVVYAVALMMDRSSFVRTMSGVLTAIAGIMFLAVPFVGESTGMLLAAASIVAAIAIVADMLALWVSRIYGAMYVAAVLAAVDLAMGVLYFAGSPQITYHAITFIAFGVWLALSAYVTGFVKVESAVNTREVKEDKQSNKASKPQAKNTKATKKAKKPEKRPEEKPKTAEVPKDEAKEEPKAAEPKKEEAPKEEPKSEPAAEEKPKQRPAPRPVTLPNRQKPEEKPKTAEVPKDEAKEEPKAAEPKKEEAPKEEPKSEPVGEKKVAESADGQKPPAKSMNDFMKKLMSSENANRVKHDAPRETPKEEPKAAEPKKEEAPKEEPKSEPVIEQTALREASEPVIEEQPEDVAVEEPIVETTEEPEEAPIEDTPEPEEHESEESAVEAVVAEPIQDVVVDEASEEPEAVPEDSVPEPVVIEQEPEEITTEEPAEPQPDWSMVSHDASQVDEPVEDMADDASDEQEAVAETVPEEPVIQEESEPVIDEPKAAYPDDAEEAAEDAPIQEDVVAEEPITEAIDEPEEAPVEEQAVESVDASTADEVSEEPEAVPEEPAEPQPDWSMVSHDASQVDEPAEEPITEAIDEPEEAPVEEPVMRESEMPSENVAEAPEQIVEPEAPQQGSEQIQSSGEMDVESGAVTESGEEVLGEDLYTDYSPEAVVRRAAWNKGLRCRRGYGPYNIPVAFVKGKVAVFVDDGDADTSIDSKLREEGWTVLRYDSSTITDGKAQGEEIAAAVKSNLRSAKAASKKKSKK